MKCCSCQKDVAYPLFNSTRTKPYCNDCYSVKYFICAVDGRARLRKWGVKLDSGKMVYYKYAIKFKCHLCGNEYTGHKPSKLIVFTGDSHSNKEICSQCEKSDKIILINSSIRLYGLRSDMVETIDGKPVHKSSAYLYKRKCAKCGLEYYEYNAHVYIFCPSNDKFYDNRLKLPLCNTCRTGATICASCGNYYISDDIISAASLTGWSKEPLCSVCCTKNIPFYFDGMVELDGNGRKIGLEVECEASPISQMHLAYWKNKKGHMVSAGEDNSLRGRWSIEYKSPILHESNFEDWIDEFCGILVGRVNNRTGLHVHIDSSMYSWRDIALIAKYCKDFENDIFRMVSPSRCVGGNGNNAGLPYLLPPVYSHFDEVRTKEQLIQLLYGHGPLWDAKNGCFLKNRRANDRNGPRYDGYIHRYQWANLHGHFHKRAIEIRLHQGTCNPTKIKNWIKLWIFLLDYASNGGRESPWSVMPEHLMYYYSNREYKLRAISPERLGE